MNSSDKYSARDGVLIGVTSALLVVSMLVLLPLQNLFLFGYIGLLMVVHGAILTVGMRKVSKRGCVFLVLAMFGLVPMIIGGPVFLLNFCLAGAAAELGVWAGGGYRGRVAPYLGAAAYAFVAVGLIVPLTLLFMPKDKVSAFAAMIVWSVTFISVGIAIAAAVLGAWVGVRLSRELRVAA
jgi:hypothetical protein